MIDDSLSELTIGAIAAFDWSIGGKGSPAHSVGLAGPQSSVVILRIANLQMPQSSIEWRNPSIVNRQ